MSLRKPNINEEIIAYDGLQTDEINKVADYIIEVGSNVNGNWEKWNSGKLVQWGRYDTETTTGRTLIGSTGFYVGTAVSRPYPIPFVGLTPYTTFGFGAGTTQAIISEGYSASLVASCNFHIYHQLANTRVSLFVNFISIGRWKE